MITKRFAALILALGILMPSYVSAKRLTIATLAPRGSSWLRILKKMARELKKKTGGRLTMKFYAGGVMGDEKLVVRKMRTGQIDGAALTSVGLSLIQPAMSVLQLPRLYKTQGCLNFVRKRIGPIIKNMMAKKGYKVLGWADMGKVYLFSKKKITSHEDLRHARMWAWENDPTSRHFMKIANIVPKPLAITDVLTSLQTGMLDTVYGTPYTMIALQWWTKIKYLIDYPLVVSIGGTVLRKKIFDALPQDQQEILMALSKKYFQKLAKRIKRDNYNSVRVLLKNGVQKIKIRPEEKRKITRMAYKVHLKFMGKRYTKALLRKAYKAVRAYWKSRR